MLDLNFVRKNVELVKRKVEAKGVPFAETVFLDLDQQRRTLVTQSETLQSQKKKLAKETGVRKQQHLDTADLEKQSIAISREIDALENELKKVEEKFNDWLLGIPNLHDDSVPVGKDHKDNAVVRSWGSAPLFSFSPKPHWELGEQSGQLDFARATKITGSRFAIYFGKLAKLERALINFMLDLHTGQNGYTEVLPPFMVNDLSLIGTGNLPKFKDDLFKIENYNFYLIPTAEVPLTNIYRDEILNEKDLPRNFVAYTPCFRSEAGSYGKDIRGLIRQHQFNKVELLKFTAPEQSFQELEKLTGHAESVLQALGLHFRTVLLCTGDMSFSSAKTYDLEVWMPARNDYVEISSCSNFVDFQARRARIRFKGDGNRKGFVHTLNGSGLAVGRTVAAIMENYQDEQGKIRIPEVLKPYFNGQDTI